MIFFFSCTKDSASSGNEIYLYQGFNSGKLWSIFSGERWSGSLAFPI